MSKTITYKGHKIKYDDAEVHKWSTLRQLSSPDGQFDAIDRILCGKADEVAEKLGDDFEEMMGLLGQISAVEGNAGKN